MLLCIAAAVAIHYGYQSTAKFLWLFVVPMLLGVIMFCVGALSRWRKQRAAHEMAKDHAALSRVRKVNLICFLSMAIAVLGYIGAMLHGVPLPNFYLVLNLLGVAAGVSLAQEYLYGRNLNE